MIQDALFGGALSALTQYRQFIVYTIAPNPSNPAKTAKYPCDFRTGRISSAMDSNIWTDAQTAVAAALNLGQSYGVGFVLTKADPLWVIDVDGAHDGEAWSPLAQTLLSWFPGAAVEVSNSLRGLHIFGTGVVPPHKTKNSAYGLELYTSDRFIALTGFNATGDASTQHDAAIAHLVATLFAPDGSSSAGSGSNLADRWEEALARGPVPEFNVRDSDEKLLDRARRSRSAGAAFGTNQVSFDDLWTANIEALARRYPDGGNASNPYDASGADAALAAHLCFWTGKDAARIERLMQQSGLRREKWERDDYLPRTILGAIERQVDILTDKEPEPLPNMVAPLPEGERRQAPRATSVTGSTFLTVEQQMELFEGCVYIMDQDRVLVPGGAKLKEKQFRVMFGGYTMPMDNANERTTRDAWEAFTQHQAYRSPRADTTCFRPDLAPAALVDGGGLVAVNTWWPIEVPRAVGDASLFYAHLEKLLPNERDRYIVMCYMAACVQHKGHKFQWAPLLQGVEGNGKTLLTRCVAEAIGARYVHWPKASKLAAQFNGWMRDKLFYAVEDIYVPGNRLDVIEELKPMITGENLEIEGKGVDQVTTNICGNFIFNSNHKDAILKTRNDRRFAVFYTAQQEAWHLQRDGMTGDYMPKIWSWLKDGGGFAVVAELLHTFPIPDEWNPARGLKRAPQTTSTEEAIEATRGGAEQDILECIGQGLPGFVGGWISTIQLERQLERLGRARQITHRKRAELLTAMGYVLHPHLVDGRTNTNVLPDAGKPRLWVRADSDLLLLTNPADIAAAYQRAQGHELKAAA